MFRRISAVVLDLDDTLIDTSGELIPAAHREAAEAMVEAGLPASVQAVHDERMRLQEERATEDIDVLAAAAFGHPSDGDAVEAGRSAYYGRQLDRLDPVPDAVPVLERLSGACTLLLMTTGDPDTQRRKVELADLGRWFVEALYLPLSAADKRRGLRDLLERHGLEPARVVVVGDRIDREIAAGNALGTWTVRVEAGEGGALRAADPGERAHFAIPGIGDLPRVLARIDASETEPDDFLDPKG